ncbi:MAG: type III-B CRISPR module RAMP protein Cmr6 [Lentisphaeria bacterium]|nr:type III-B CRISPR module RAMP protein Cmr6 [Lentisphaeria bacterium]
MICATPKTREFWGAVRGLHEHARSLAAAKMIDFPDGDRDNGWRRRSCEAIRDGRAITDKLGSWCAFCRSLPAREGGLLFARLRAPLALNLAGGVLENGGLSLDRNSGLPFIPGSSVKGCARKAVLIRLREEPDPEGKAKLVEQIARVFGWSDGDWKDGRRPGADGGAEYYSDLCYACDRHWPYVRMAVATRLAERLTLNVTRSERPWERLPSAAGAILFLPAYPFQKDPGIDLDIVTPHHMGYYQGDPEFAAAPDTEEPKPSIFPVVPCHAGPVFLFTLAPAAKAAPQDLACAREWLREGLTLWGIGGKTSSGYGWFEASEELDREQLVVLREKDRAAQAAEALRLAEERRTREEEEARRRKAELQSLPPDQRARAEVQEWNDALFRTRLEHFANERKKGGPADDHQRMAIIEALRGPRRTLWTEFRAAATAGAAAKTVNLIYKFCKDRGLDKP